MVICPNCFKDVMDKKFCEECGAPLKEKAASPSPEPEIAIEPEEQIIHTPESQMPQTEFVAPASKIEKECPFCHNIYPGDANYCKECKLEGLPVSLVEKGKMKQTVIRLVNPESGKALEFPIMASRQFGREDFKTWYQSDSLISKDEWSHISKKHFMIEKKRDGTFVLMDTKSSNGTQLNGFWLAAEEPNQIDKDSELSLPLGGQKMMRVQIDIK